jgi:hypothetical protein
VNCPHCQAEITETEFRTLRGQFAGSKRKSNGGGRPKKPKVRIALNAREAGDQQGKDGGDLMKAILASPERGHTSSRSGPVPTRPTSSRKAQPEPIQRRSQAAASRSASPRPLIAKPVAGYVRRIRPVPVPPIDRDDLDKDQDWGA